MKKVSILLAFLMITSLSIPCFWSIEANAAGIIFCPQCGKKISSDSVFCMFCGARIPEMNATSSAKTPSSDANTGVSDVRIGDTVFFGEYEQNNNYYNGKEKIEWYVIARDGDQVKLLSKYALDRQPFHTDWVEVTWETCSLREWLNGTFLEEAFSNTEQRSILPSQVNADKNPNYKTKPGHGTMDKMFCLSVNEFENLPKTLKPCKGTAFCYAEGARESQNGNCSWWLRTPGWYEKSAVDVNNNGVANYDEKLYKGYNVNHRGHGVRPAMWIDISGLE